MTTDATENTPFWKGKSLSEMSREEWESLCDGCGQCCRVKLIDEDGTIEKTRLGCKLLDVGSCRCRNYPERHSLVDDCVALDPENVMSLAWMPDTCAYRLIGEGKDLYWWHPLVSGSPDTVYAAGVSVRGKLINEDKIKPKRIWNYVTKDW